VTGVTSGIGEMIARGLLIGGAEVFITGRDVATARSKAGELGQWGVCAALAVDLSDPDGPARLASQLAEAAPKLSILVNNAGTLVRTAFGDCLPSDWDNVLNLNLRAPFLLSQALWPLLKQNASRERPAQIINVGSASGLRAPPHDTYAYSASKAGLHHMTAVLARRLAPDAVNVNAIAPGLFPSRLVERYKHDPEAAAVARAAIPMARFGDPDDMAALVISIAASRYMTGDVIAIDGGVSLGF
jgi:NAD(P)-dependent dehydrogenase (short-subunit alcohol dehydrogenase family)